MSLWLAFGLVAFVGCAVQVGIWLRSGTIPPWGLSAIRRAEFPILFWIHVVVFSVAATIGLIVAISSLIANQN